MVNQKIADLAVAATVETVFASDENIYSINPRIYAKPTYKVREEKLET